MSSSVVIVSAARTPIGSLLGDLSTLPAHVLGATAIKAAVQRSSIAADAVEEVLMGNCLMAGQGQAPARQAALGAGLPVSAGAVTLSKMCGSGMRAVMFAHDMVASGSARAVVAGGMESMSNAPHLTYLRRGHKYGAKALSDHMALDGLEDAYAPGTPMGAFAEACVARYGFSRQAQDDFAVRSTQRSRAANEDGSFAWEMAPVELAGGASTAVVERDEQPFKARLDKIATLKPAFAPQGSVTAANSSSISDGAAALVLMEEKAAMAAGARPIARIAGHAVHAQEPQWFATAPIGAIKKLMVRTGWATRDVALWEINEAFAAVTMAAMRDLEISHDVVNVHGGACALGHPIGASGARIIVTLLGALRRRQLARGIAALCIGGGEATAIAVEML